MGEEVGIMKVATWNVNSIRSRLEHSVSFLKQQDPCLLLLQETKCIDDLFPHDQFSNMPYNISINGQKSYNGVAIFSKYPIDEVKTDFVGNPCPEQARFLEVTCSTPIGYSRIISVYVPNGGKVGSEKFNMKLEFLSSFTSYLNSIDANDENLIVGGDFNVAPFDIDVYDSTVLANTTCFTEIEKNKMRLLLNMGFEDLYRLANPGSQEFSWWDYRAAGFQRNLGMRIDFLLGNNNVLSKLKACYIDTSLRSKPQPSDHAPVIAEFINATAQSSIQF